MVYAASFSTGSNHIITSYDHLIRVRWHFIQAEQPLHYPLLSAENDDVIKQSCGCHQCTTVMPCPQGQLDFA
jgi:hypothetical protein